MAFFSLVSLFSSLLLLPLLLWVPELVIEMSSEYLLLLALTGIFQALYLLGLAQAYRTERLSIIYPMARALPVAIVPVCLSLFADKHYSLGQYLGVIAIIVGSLLIPHERMRNIELAAFTNRGSLFALLAALATSGYTLVDSKVLNDYRALAPDVPSLQSALCYMLLLSLSATLFSVLFSMATKAGRQQWPNVLGAQVKTAFATAAMMNLTYSLVLIAMNFASNVGYIVALRQLSIPIGVCLGVVLLGEHFSRNQKLALVLIMIGIYSVISLA